MWDPVSSLGWETWGSYLPLRLDFFKNDLRILKSRSNCRTLIRYFIHVWNQVGYLNI